MKTRSRRTSLWGSRALLGAFALMMALGPLGCASTLPREHWWQFWRPKATATSGVFAADKVVLPPPPDVLGGAAGGSTLPPPPVTGATTTEGDVLRQRADQTVSQLQTVHFDYDSSDLSPEAMRALDQNAQWLLGHPGLNILIEGHCDERGSVEYNLNLGDRRAKTVRAYLTQKGVPGDSLHTMSYGKERPLDPARTEAAFQKNRRAQFFVY